MTRALLLTILVGLTAFYPNISHAAWWNPLEWIAKTGVLKNVSEPSEKIAQLEKENLALREQLEALSKNPNTCVDAEVKKIISTPRKTEAANTTAPAVVTTEIKKSETINSDAKKAAALRVELARLDKLEMDIASYVNRNDKIGNEALLSLLSSEVKMDGDFLFPKVGYAVKVWYMTDVGTFGLSSIKYFMDKQIENYRADLKIELAQYPVGS